MAGAEHGGAGNGGFRIGNRELYHMLTEVRDRMFAVERRLDNLDTRVNSVLKDNQDLRKENRDRLEGLRDNHNDRLRKLEFRYYGVLAGFGLALLYVFRDVLGGGLL